MNAQEVEIQLHEQWMQHPITRQLINKINEHKEKFVTQLSTHASDQSITDQTIRSYAINIRNTDAILKLIHNN